MDLQWIAPPIIGGIIGLITNSLAIKMLFRPLKPVFLGRYQLPFTPGLIPKEQSRIAKAIGLVVGRDLLDKDTLCSALCSENMKEVLAQKIQGLLEWARTTEESLGGLLARRKLRGKADDMAQKAQEQISVYVTDRLLEQNLGNTLIDYAMEEIVEKLNPMVKMFAGPAVENSREDLAARIDGLIGEKTPQIVGTYVHDTYEDWMDKPLSQLGEKLWDKKDEIQEQVWGVYEKTMREKAPDLVKTLNVEKIVEEKISEFSPAQLEQLILEISRKELRAVIWLGGVLGMLMGFLNLLF